MPIYRVVFSSPSAHYAGNITADNELQAKRRFGNGAFSDSEIRMMTARQIIDGEEE